MSGQVSLAHISFMAIGVAAFSHLAVEYHWPWLVALLVAGLIAAPIGALLAIPAIRFQAFTWRSQRWVRILLQQMFYSQTYMFGNFGAGITIPRPHVSWLDLVATMATTTRPRHNYRRHWIVVLINRSRLAGCYGRCPIVRLV